MICKNCGMPVTPGEWFGWDTIEWVHDSYNQVNCLAKTVAKGIPEPTKQCPTCNGEGKVRIK